MKPELAYTINHGHPWTGQTEWDLLEIKAESEADMDAEIDKAAHHFWKVWCRDVNMCQATLYKPTYATADWEDLPA